MKKSMNLSITFLSEHNFLSTLLAETIFVFLKSEQEEEQEKECCVFIQLLWIIRQTIKDQICIITPTSWKSQNLKLKRQKQTIFHGHKTLTTLEFMFVFQAEAALNALWNASGGCAPLSFTFPLIWKKQYKVRIQDYE